MNSPGDYLSCTFPFPKASEHISSEASYDEYVREQEIYPAYSDMPNWWENKANVIDHDTNTYPHHKQNSATQNCVNNQIELPEQLHVAGTDNLKNGKNTPRCIHD